VRAAVIALAASLVLFPLVVRSAYAQDVGATVLLAAIAASAWNIVGGYAGQISVGHAVFFGIGAYAPLLVYQRWQVAPTAGIPLGIAVSLILALLVGFPTFRLKGHYFSMATIAVAELARIVVSNVPFLGAAIGLQGPAVPRSVWDFTFRSAVPYYYAFLIALALVLLVTWYIQANRLGYYLRAIRAQERAAGSLGVSVRRYKLHALLLSAAFTSIAGSLYALKTGFVDPESVFGILVSVQMIITPALGGAGTLFGPLVGALILVPLQAATNVSFGGSGSGITYIVYGGIILLVARFEPGGLSEVWRRLIPRLTFIRASRRAA